MSRCDPRAAFTTLGVPIFFMALYAVTLIAGLPLALLFSPLLLRLALVIVPPPTRLSLPTCPHLARCEAERARRKAARRGEESPRPAPVFDPDRGGVRWKGRYLMPDPDRPGVYVLAIAPAAAPATPLASSPRPTAPIAAPVAPARLLAVATPAPASVVERTRAAA